MKFFISFFLCVSSFGQQLANQNVRTLGGGVVKHPHVSFPTVDNSASHSVKLHFDSPDEMEPIRSIL